MADLPKNIKNTVTEKNISPSILIALANDIKDVTKLEEAITVAISEAKSEGKTKVTTKDVHKAVTTDNLKTVLAKFFFEGEKEQVLPNETKISWDGTNAKVTLFVEGKELVSFGKDRQNDLKTVLKILFK